MECNNKLGVMAFGLAFGIMWGVGILFLGLASYWMMWGSSMVTMLGSFYVGFNSTIVGSFIGGLWGFCDGFIGGAVLAWLYNIFSSKNKSSDSENMTTETIESTNEDKSSESQATDNQATDNQATDNQADDNQADDNQADDNQADENKDDTPSDDKNKM